VSSPGRFGSATAVLLLALALRAALFPFADNKHGDAPMRALVAERMVIEPGTASVPRTYCQFGPLHTTLMRPFLAADGYAPRSSRLLSLLAGIAVFFPFLAFARRLAGPGHAELAAFVLAVSPLHLQASTTAASEALYLLLWIGAIERLLAALETRRRRTFAVAGLLASLAAVTRYDAWLALPMMAVAAWVLVPGRGGARDRALAGGLVVFAACAALFPAAWLLWGALRSDDPLFFAHYITSDHAGLAATASARYGVVLGRLRQLGVWTLAFVAAMTLPAAVLGTAAVTRRWRALPGAARLVVVAALGPPAVYLARGLIFGTFEPLARFGLVPGALLLPLAARAVPLDRAARFRALTVASAAAFSIVVWLVATAGRERIWAGAESMGALTRLDREDRDLAAYLRAHRPAGAPVMIEPKAFAEIGVAHAAGVPWTQSITLIVTREPRATVAETVRATGARFLVGYDGGWPARLPDWPARDTRIGHWHVVEAAEGSVSPARLP
jgi:hypothetical protein